MPVKLDLRKQAKADEDVRKETANKALSKQTVRKPITSRTKRGQGRPKGEPAVTRSLRIKEDINERFIERHERTKMSFNDMVNEALDAYLD